MIRTLWILCKKLCSFRGQSTNKTIYIDIPNNYYRRYLFILVRLFAIEGYDVLFKVSPRFIASLLFEPYSVKLIGESTVSFTFFTQKTEALPLVHSYFQYEGYRVPITMHPNQYISNLWREQYKEVERHNQLFFVGSFTPSLYKKLQKQFGVLNRNELLHSIRQLCHTYQAYSFESIYDVPEADLVIMDSSDAIVPFDKNRETLATFRYMLAFPGANMPLCHNITEALSVGTVPLIQESYAQLLSPPLEHNKNALLYRDLSDLKEVVKMARGLSNSEYATLSNNSKAYYETHCTPSVIISRILREESPIALLGAI